MNFTFWNKKSKKKINKWIFKEISLELTKINCFYQIKNQNI